MNNPHAPHQPDDAWAALLHTMADLLEAVASNDYVRAHHEATTLEWVLEDIDEVDPLRPRSNGVRVDLVRVLVAVDELCKSDQPHKEERPEQPLPEASRPMHSDDERAEDGRQRLAV